MTEQGKKYLSDILRAIELIDQFTSSVSNYSEYLLKKAEILKKLN
jgi:uncharacterized protein with HEPN domain